MNITIANVKMAGIFAAIALMPTIASTAIAEVRVESGFVDAPWVGDGQADRNGADWYAEDPAPAFRADFVLPKGVTESRVRFACAGFGSFAVNGRAYMNEDGLDTLWSVYDKTIYAKSVLCRGLLPFPATNSVCVTLGNGFYNLPPLRFWGSICFRENLAHGRPCFKLAIDNVTVPLNWKWRETNILRNSPYLGTEMDATRPEDTEWKNAAIVQGPKGVLVDGSAKGLCMGSHDIHRGAAKWLREGAVQVVDFGVNASGVPVFTFANEVRGTRIEIVYGERLNADGTVNVLTQAAGQIKRKGRGGPGAPDIAAQRDVYVCGGAAKGERFSPPFTWHIFRYAEIRGAKHLVTAPTRTVRSMVSTDSKYAAPAAKAFKTRNPNLKALHDVCRRTFQANLIGGIQSDCPGRERLGYGGDIVATCEAMCLNFDMKELYLKALRDFADEAADDGWITETAPYVGIADSGSNKRSGPISWTLAVPVLMDTLLRHYPEAAERILSFYPVCTRYVGLMAAKYPDGIIPKCIGDHEAIQRASNDCTATAHWHEFVRLTATFARRLGKADDAKRLEALAAKIRGAFQAKYVKDGIVSNGSQSAQAIGLYLGLVPAEQIAAAEAQLMKALEAHDYAPTTGIFSTRYMLLYLSEHGKRDIAEKIVLHRGFPGWMNMLDSGATTLWETWKESDNTFSNCHPMFGSVDEWILRFGTQPALQRNAAKTTAKVDVGAEVKALAKEADQLRRQKKGDEALAAARKIGELVKASPTVWQLQQQYYNALGGAYMVKKDYRNAFEAYLMEAENHNPHFGAGFHGMGAPIELMREDKTEEARAMLKRVWAIDKVEPRVLAEAIDVEARTYKVDKNWPAIVQLYDRIFADTNLVARIGHPAGLVKKMVEAYKDSNQGYKAIWKVYDDALANPKKYGVTTADDLKELVGAYADYSWHSLDVARMRDAKKRAADLGFVPGGMFQSVLKYHEELPAFPKTEAELNIPTDAKAFLGFDPAKKVVHAKDFGWNATNATECLQKAINSDATTIIIDAMPSPWYIWTVKFMPSNSNRKIVFQKGCTVLTAPEHKVKNTPGWYRNNIFQLEKCTNVWFEGEGTLGKDVYIGKYRNRAERLKWNWYYGGHGFGTAGARHIVFKNLWVANCGQDALGCNMHHSYVIDCLFDDNYRQGVSFGGSSHCVFKNVTFCNTFGGEPHCGIDFEPYYEIYLCAYHYFFDCKFYNNASKNVIFATSTYAPMAAYFKRCQFEAQRNGNICINARLGIYLKAVCHAPSNIIFDECRIDGYSDGRANPIQFGSTFLYDVTFKDCVINDKGKFGRDGDHKASPIKLTLDRGVWDGYYPYPGVVTFKNTKVNGYEGVPLVEVVDKNGKYCVNSFRGTINHNGKQIDMSAFDYQPPDRTHGDSAEADTKTLVPATGSARNWQPSFDFSFTANWYQSLPTYTMLCSGKKGEKGTFTVDLRAISHPGDTIRVTRPDGKTEHVYQPEKRGVNTFSYTFPADGVYAFDMNIVQDLDNRDAPKSGFYILDIKGAKPAWQACKSELGRRVGIKTGDDYAAYTGYFEVPAKEACAIKLMSGGVEIRDAAGKVVRRALPTDYNGMMCIDFTTKENEIWSFTTIGPHVQMKFFAPLPGIWADDPEDLPTYGRDLAFTRQKRTGASAAEMPKAVLFPLPISGAIAKAVDAEAARRAAFGATNDVIKAYSKAAYHYRWMEPAMQRPTDLAMMDAELASLEPMRKRRDMQQAAKRESADLRRYVAFVSLYAPLLALDDTAAKAWVEKWSGGKVEKCDEDDEALAEATNAAINPYGVEWLEDGIYYEDYMGIVKLAPFIANRLKALGY